MWAPMAEWEQFAEEIKDLPKDHPQVAAALKRVEQRRERDREMMDEKPPMQGYTAIIEAASDGTFGVFFPDLPGCTSAGDTIEEATTNAAEVMEFHLENMDDWPAPTDPASIVVHSDVIEVARIQVPAPAR
jgi:predicted RNase H-like HicB family nuclease